MEIPSLCGSRLDRVTLPGLKRLTDASDFTARLNVYNGEFDEHGGGMTATTYVAESLDAMIIDVTGADPKTPQTAELKLWAPRQPEASAHKRDWYSRGDLA